MRRLKIDMNKQGFTLIEMLFITAVIGLLATISIPLILGAWENSVNRLAESNLQLVEKAKGMLQLPPEVYEAGQSVPEGTAYGEGAYTESNLMACIRNKSSLSELHFSNARLIPGAIGEKAYYSYDFEDSGDGESGAGD